MTAEQKRYREGLVLIFPDDVTVSDDVFGVHSAQRSTTDWPAPNYRNETILSLATMLDQPYFHNTNEYRCYLEDYFLSEETLIEHEKLIKQLWRENNDIILSLSSSKKEESREQFLVYGYDSYFNDAMTMWAIVYFFSKDRNQKK